MKTAEQWIESWDKKNVSNENCKKHLAILRQIQLDSFRAGMMFATSLEYPEGSSQVSIEAIKQTASTLVEIPKGIV